MLLGAIKRKKSIPVSKALQLMDSLEDDTHMNRGYKNVYDSYGEPVYQKVVKAVAKKHNMSYKELDRKLKPYI